MRPFNSQGDFEAAITTGHRRKAVRGAGAAIAGQAANFILSMGSVVILARLLSPTDFGVVTMVTTFGLLFRSFGYTGFTELIVQHDGLNALANEQSLLGRSGSRGAAHNCLRCVGATDGGLLP